ncbi:MAG TPA: hypothetical protein VFQ78_02830 [Candidatus Udaeobacter sp.]|nr:hypothetical protein [Candidatus Udaeobacter sp.]
MSAPLIEPVDLLDLKFLPAWLKQSDARNHYQDYSGEEHALDPRSSDGNGRHQGRKFRSRDGQRHSQHARSKRDGRQRGGMPKRAEIRGPGSERRRNRRSPNFGALAEQQPEVSIRFLPRLNVLENVVTQIKSGSVAYSLFAMARLVLEKPGRYEVQLTAKAEASLYQLGEAGAVSVNREFLDRNAFRFAQRDFYRIEVVKSDPIKGNFSNVARCRLSGTLLGPTNHHAYQPQLRSLYEQRFSRRMNFADFQRQIEVVSDSALVERWKDEARNVTTYTTLREERSVTFSSAAETERHFRSNYSQELIRSCEEVTIGGAVSRQLPDRVLNRAIEQAWLRETRSPSNMMQELAGRFRQNGLCIFRHRRGMLFVSPIRTRAFVHEQAGVSSSVNAILDTLLSAVGINRKQLFEKLTAGVATEEVEARTLAFAADLRWLINEGYVIEFNDGSLDLPRTKSRPQESGATDEATKGPSSGSFVGKMELALATPRVLALYLPTIFKERAQPSS